MGGGEAEAWQTVKLCIFCRTQKKKMMKKKKMEEKKGRFLKLTRALKKWNVRDTGAKMRAFHILIFACTDKA